MCLRGYVLTGWRVDAVLHPLSLEIIEVSIFPPVLATQRVLLRSNSPDKAALDPSVANIKLEWPESLVLRRGTALPNRVSL